MSTKAPAKRNSTKFFNEEQVELIKAHLLKGAPDHEVERFIITCERTGLDPFTRQIYGRLQSTRVRKPGTKGNDNSSFEWIKVVVIITSIDGLRAIAERTGEYRGQTAPEWYYLNQDSGKPEWQDVCLVARDSNHNPLTQIEACRVGVKRLNFDAPVFGVANFDSFAVFEKDDSGKWYLGTFWRKMPEHMIAKVAEAQAFRKAFPVLTQGLYIEEEIVDQEAAEQRPTKNEPLPADMKMATTVTKEEAAENKAKVEPEKTPAPAKPKAEKPATVKQPQPDPKPQPKPDNEQSPFDTETDETPMVEETIEEPAPRQTKAEAAAWKEYEIKTIKSAKYMGKKLGEMERKDIEALMNGWVLKFPDKIAEDPDKVKEAEAITSAFNAKP
jgi:phage recombination protein Bet